MTTYFVTRHPGAVAWAKSVELQYDVHLEHLMSLEQVQAEDVVIGTLPINMVYALNRKSVRYIHLSLNIPPTLRGMELNVEQLKQCQATLEEFTVEKRSSEFDQIG
ncbi:CRISPR-associated protein Csx16 [Acinetobacter variabilis]|uniref:CRISPR-associated protein Csx16 n=1 Tax=Acinetobacter variabilis TaxID=70346 RepID=UPI003A83DBBB